MNDTVEQEYALWFEVWNTLVNTCGAKDERWDRERFMITHAFSEMPRHTKEWNFEGKLGMGGKFLWRNWQFVVSFYPADKTAEREQIKATADAQLKPLFERLQAIRNQRTEVEPLT